VVGLAAVADLELCSRWDLGAGAVHDLLGGPPRRYSERYAAVDPAGLVPLGVPVTLVHGSRDDRVPIAMTFEYAERARASGDEVEVVELPATDHFAVIDPLSQAWPRVLAAIAERSNPNSTPTR
jgi:pimeloyl-ACP methyl ester carboxylesterase